MTTSSHDISTASARPQAAPPRARDFATVPLQVVGMDAGLDDTRCRMDLLGVSALAVVDQGPAVVGIVSRADVLRAMRLRVAADGPGPVMRLPDGLDVGEVMGRDVYRVEASDTLALAARTMLRHGVHRVIVDQDGSPLAILAAADLVRAAVELRLDAKSGAYAHAPILRVRAKDPLRLAVDRLRKSHRHGLLVFDGSLVVGSFDQDDALRARGLAGDTPVDQAMSAAMAVVDHRLPLWRAAQQLAALGVDRAVVTERGEPIGVLTATDVVRAIAETG